MSTEAIAVAVLGAGPGGLAMAAHLSLEGHEVRLWSSDRAELAPVLERGILTIGGLIEGEAVLRSVTDDIAEAVDGCRVVMVTTSAYQHVDVAGACAPYLREDQLLVLNPGRTGGALEFRHAIAESGNEAPIVVGEAASLLYGCRAIGPARVEVHRIKRKVLVAVLPAARRDWAVAVLNRLLPRFEAGRDVLVTGLQNVGSILHPAPMLFNAARIESGSSFGFYREGITPFVANFLMKLDSERVAVARGLGIKEVMALGDWLHFSLNAQGENLMSWKDVYEDSPAPKELNHRYVLDDVPYSLVPVAALGQLAGVPTPAMNALIDLFCVAFDRDFRKEGRNLARLGLSGMSADQVLQAVHG